MTSYNLFLANFHFVRPLWLLAIIVLFLVLWLLKKHRFHQSPWQKFLPPHLSGVLVECATNSSTPTKQPLHERLFLIKPLFIGLLSIIALAGPAWQKLPQPVYQTERGSVLIMDMSYSMYATDIKPNRLTRARFKAIDLLNKINDGDVGLIAYAGDAFVISPLTQDIKNIELLLPSLTPEIMPELGANPYAALTLAHEMLTNAGHLTGDIYWFTDDVDNEELSDIFDWSSKFGHRLNILGIGSQNGAPIKLPSGELLKDNNGAIVVPRLPVKKLQSLASRGQGNYQTISNGDSDIDNLISTFDVLDNNKSKQQPSQQTGDQWQEQGAWLLLLVLPLTLSYFRRGGAILVLPLTCLPLLFLLSFSLISPVSYANESSGNNETTSASSFLQKTWQGLWKTNDQQAQQQYDQENYQSAAQQFENSQWQGSAHYKAGNYQEALDAFTQGEQSDTANSLYNQGNALAKMQKYEEAIEAYEQALKKTPDLQDAKDNIEKLKAQQKQEQDKNEQSEGDKSKDDKSENDASENKGDKQQEQDNDSQQSQDKSDKKQDQQSSEDSTNEPQQKDKQQEQSQSESDKKESENESEQKQEQQAKQAEESTEQGEEKTAAQVAAEQQAKETTQKHQQLLNKVTDDPYLLLRNKMQLEYQKRRQDGASQGVNKKW
ncbi:MAG: VWA domain-containing protein [Colwellia sp.]|nr:VWA domain-containing protein [Colwellia sp.]